MTRKTVVLLVVMLLGCTNQEKEQVAVQTNAKAPTKSQLAEFQQLVRYGNITTDEFEDFLKQNRNRVTAPPSTLQPEGCVKATVNYDLGPADMARNYDMIFSSSEEFQIVPRMRGKAVREICWFKFGNSIYPGEVRSRIEAGGKFIVANVWELHAFGQVRPSLRRKFFIASLGSFWLGADGIALYALIREDERGHRLNKFWFGPETRKRFDEYRFLAIRK